jgi:tetratricopeptide (TPR) repeat protein
MMAQESEWRSHRDAAMRAVKERNFDVAETEARAAETAALKLGDTDARHLRSLEDLARVQLERRNFAGSEGTLKHALELLPRGSASNQDPELANSLRRSLARTLGALSVTQPRAPFVESATYSREALALLARTNVLNASEVMPHLSRLGVLLMDDGRYSASEAVFLRAMAVNPDAAAMSDLAELYRRAGRFEEAEKLLNDAISLDANAETKSGMSVGFARLHRLGVLNWDMGRYDIAEPVLKQARESARGPVQTVLASWGVARNHCARGKYSEAFVAFNEALAGNRDNFRSEQNHVRGHIVADMARCAIKSRDFENAERLLSEASALFQRWLRPQHPEVARLMQAQATMFSRQKKTSEAEQLLRRTIPMLEAAAGKDAPVLIAPLQELAAILKATGRPQEAQEALTRVRAIQSSNTKRVRPVLVRMAPYQAAEPAYWDSIKDSDNRLLFRRYAREFPNGRYSAEAAELYRKFETAGGAPCALDYDDLPADSLAGCVAYWVKSGYRPAALASYVKDGKRLFTGSFQKGGSRLLTSSLTPSEVGQTLDVYRSRGERPERIDAGPGPDYRLAVTWTRLEPSAIVSSGAVGEKLKTELESYSGRNLINTALTLFPANGLQYVSVWTPAPAGIDTKSYFDLTIQQTRDLFQSLPRAGYRPLQFHPYQTPGGIRWADIWVKSEGGPWWGYHSLRRESYLSMREDLALKGYQLIDVCAFGSQFAAVWHRPDGNKQ